MDDCAGLAERGRVHVFDAPRQSGRGAVMLAVDDIADPADGQADHGRGTRGVEDLPEREVRPAGPDVSAERGSEQPAPLTDAALRQGEHSEQLSAGEEPEVLPYIQKARADETDHDHPRHAVRAASRVDAVFLQEPQTKPCPGE